MATITKRGKNFRVQIRYKGVSLSESFPNKKEAREWSENQETWIREGKINPEASRHTLNELVERYSRTFLKQKRSACDQARQLNWWCAQIGEQVLADIKPATLSELKETLADTHAPATVNRYLAALSHPFTIAVTEWHWLDSNPVTKVRKLKEPRGRIRFLSDDERARLLEACKAESESLHRVVVLALSTGMRKGELENLKWQDIDIKQKRITLKKTKNEDVRAVPLTGYALELLSNIKVRPLRGYAFTESVRYAWERARRAAVIDDLVFHDLRHSAASYLAMNGATLVEIAEILGHKSLAMTKRYSHLTQSHVSIVVERMNREIFFSD